jgi:hypothetical protein
MKWMVKLPSGEWWHDTSSITENVGVSGYPIKDKFHASRFPDSRKQRQDFPLPQGYEWVIDPVRHKNATDIQSAVNPAGIALALHEAFREIIAEGGDTAAQQNDPAAKLIMHHLCYLLGVGDGLSMSDYHNYYQFCETQTRMNTER